MKKYFLLCVFHMLFCCALFAQDEIQTKIDSLEKKLRIAVKEKTRGEIFHQLGNMYYDLDSKRALGYYDSALTLRKKTEDIQGIANTSNNIGLIYEERGNYKMALEYFSESLQNHIDIGNEKDIAEVKNNISLAYHGLGLYDNELENCTEALKYFEKAGDERNMGKALNNIGRAFCSKEIYDSAIVYQKRAYEQFKKIDDISEMAKTLNNIGAAYYQLKVLDEAEKYLKSSLDIQSTSGSTKEEANAFINLGLIYREREKFPEAKDYYLKGLNIHRANNNLLGMAQSFINLGELSLHMSNYDEAKDYLNAGLTIVRQTEAKDLLQNYYEILSFVYEKSENYDEALKYYKSYLEIKNSSDTITRESSINLTYQLKDKQLRIASLEVLYSKKETEKRIWVIALSGIILISIILGYIRSKRIKEKAFKEITEAKLASLKSLMDKHFISGSLNSIDGFLNNHDSESASDYLVKYSKLIRNILHFSDKPEVTLEEEVELCKSFLYLEKIHYDNSFDYSFEMDSTISVTSTLFPSLLLQPIIENAVKHGVGSLTEDKNTRGLIKVTIKRDYDKLVCRVTDNGRALGFSSGNSGNHQSYSGKGIMERIRVYNSIRRNKASFSLSDNKPGVSAELVVPYMEIKQSQRMTA